MKTLFAVLLLVLPALSVNAQNADDAIAAWERGDYQTAFEIWQPLAEGGDQDAQFGLINLYTYGRGTPRDRKKAYIWLIIATSDEPDAAVRLRDHLAGFLSAAEQADAERLAREWIAKHSE